jgi:hypothetical protein
MHKAKKLALETCTANGYPLDGRRVWDTDFPATMPACYIVRMDSDNGVVVYEDDPRTVVAVGNRPKRFIPTPEE